MRIALALFACATALVFTAGCSDDTCSPCAPVVTDQPLAEFSFGMGGDVPAVPSDTLGISFVSPNAETLFSVRVTPADQGTARMVNAGVYPKFRAAAARLSDGVDDMWSAWVHTLPGDYGGGSGTTESRWLKGGLSGEYTPDLHGAEITMIWIVPREVTVAHAGDRTSYTIDVLVIIMGKP